MDDKEKYELAKKRYEEFIQKMTSTIKEEDNELLAAYVTTTEGVTKQDFYWTDHEISPTALLRWINAYNNTTKKRTEWITEARLEPTTYNKLLPMYQDLQEPLIINKVTVLCNGVLEK